MWVNEFNAMIDFTKNFLEPFHQMSELELTQDGDGNKVSPWVATSELLFLFWGYFLSQHSKAKLWRHDKSPNVKIPGEKSPTEEKSPTSPPNQDLAKRNQTYLLKLSIIFFRAMFSMPDTRNGEVRTTLSPI